MQCSIPVCCIKVKEEVHRGGVFCPIVTLLLMLLLFFFPNFIVFLLAVLCIGRFA